MLPSSVETQTDLLSTAFVHTIIVCCLHDGSHLVLVFRAHFNHSSSAYLIGNLRNIRFGLVLALCFQMSSLCQPVLKPVCP